MMIKRFLSITMALLLAAALFGCTPKTPSGNDHDAGNSPYLNNAGQAVPLSIHATDENILYNAEYNPLYTEANNDFAITMVNALDKSWTGVFSPLSLQVALQILANGGDEETAQMLLNEVGPGMTRDIVNSSAANLIGKLLKSEGVSINNAVVVNKAYQICEKFAHTAADYYRASVGALDFSNPKAAVKELNKWISKNTGGLIDKLLEEKDVGADTAMVIINTLFLKLNWKTPFVKLKDVSTFHGSKGDSAVSMLNVTSGFGYQKFDQGQLVIVPYEGGEYNMAVILPEEGVSPAEAIAAMIGRFDGCETMEVKLMMPAVKLDSKLDIMDMASKLNLEAGLRGLYPELINDGDVEIEKVLQGATLEVTETGTTAAAATAVIGKKNAMPPQADVEVICDRPYAMIIYNVETSTILFVSVVNDVG
ncbi:MAG: hypothetical protein J5586_06525 [Clostridia bacterium]|nr:hypothetical protein [Clostridia bacterium]